MRWFAGWHTGKRDGSNGRLPLPSARPAPSDGQRAAVDDEALTTAGGWESWELRTVRSGTSLVTVFGACLATDAELSAAVAEASRIGNYERLSLLPGSFVSVIRDRVGDCASVGARTVVVPDIAGQHAIFYVQQAGGVVFASAALPLADLGDASPDAESLASRLFCPDVPELVGDRSVFATVSRTRPGHALVLEGDAVRQMRLPIQLGGADYAEAAVRLRRELQRSVATRVGWTDRTSADLSGGMDSSTLTLLASARLPANLLAVTHHDPRSGNDDDLAYAELCATTTTRLQHVVVRTDDTALPFQDLQHAPMADEPSQESLFFARTRTMFAPVISARSLVHLTGDGGDAVLGGDLSYLAELVRVHRFRDLVREGTAWARLRNRSAHPILRAAVRAALTDYPGAIQRTARELRNGGTIERSGHRDASHLVRWCAVGPAVAWATRRGRLELVERLEQTAAALRREESSGFARPGDASVLRGLQWNGGTARVDNELTRGLGVNLHSPFFDNNVVRACLSVSVTDRVTTSRAKPLLAAAMTGLVPSAVLERRTKGDYTAAHYAGFRRAAGELRRLLAQPRLADLGLLEPAPARAALERAINGVAAPIAALSDVLATELWLQQLTDAPFNSYVNPGSWTAEEVQHA